MMYKFSILLYIISCIGLIIILVCGASYVKFTYGIKQDEKDWSDTLQKEREQRSNEAGREAFERLDQIYGDSATE